jgi:hypothetical protein
MYSSYISGILIFLSFILSIYSYFFYKDLLIISGLCAWISFVIFFITLQKKKLLLVLLSLSFIFFSICLFNSFKINYYNIFTVNQYLITLLIGVGFLRLIATPNNINLDEVPPKGINSFVKTYFGVHLFASVINLSALILIADKMYKKNFLTNTQIILLTRSFANDAYWSPFFVAFAAAVVYMPKLNTSIILANGIVLSLIGFLITYFEVKNDRNNLINMFEGYPISFSSLYLPFSLAFLVLLTNYFFPQIKVIILISLFSFFLALIILPIKKSIKKAISEIINHILVELPKMKAEISLFLVAGMFGVIMSSILLGLNLQLPFEKFDWIIASILLAIFIFLGFIGIHPLITIAIIGDLLNQVDHTLLAVTFLMAWATTVSTSPFSGSNLTIVSRYDFNAKDIFKLNMFYALKMYVVSVIFLFILYKYLN